LIEVDGLSKSFRIRRALADLAFTVPSGGICGLVGPNGAGKTTLLKILATLIRPDRGSARVAGFDIRVQPEEVRARIGYMPDVFVADEDVRVEAYLQFFAHVYGLDASRSWRVIDDMLKLVDLFHLRSRSITHLSLGARQRLAVARVLLHDPAVLLLDEPVSGLDPIARVEMRALIKELGRMGKTVLISSHVLPDLDGLCDRLVVLDQGRLLFLGSPDELKRRVFPEKAVEVAVEGDGEAARALLAARPWVKEARALADGGLLVVLDGEDASAARIAHELHEAGFRIARLGERRPDLEEAFIELTRGKEA